MKKLLVAPFVLVAVAVGCSASETDFQTAAEEAITGSFAELNDVEVSDASCDEPESTEVGTTFACTAEIEGFGTTDFIASIVSDNEVNVEAVQ
ncbi:MAG: DUF4333 domain-containing protein [Ilumatobacter sp.]|uniref:DUF4333 domain-containing protein n=1 Tax=Ilumatobacter sp. TaxID=1967498 RepID=UPI00329811A5